MISNDKKKKLEKGHEPKGREKQKVSPDRCIPAIALELHL
jgi:hypothetical protein